MLEPAMAARADPQRRARPPAGLPPAGPRLGSRALRAWSARAAFVLSIGAHVAAQAAPVRDAYEVFYHHVLRNRTDQELRDVVVYLPVPVSDAYQTIDAFRIERDTGVHISNRRDAFGTPIQRVAIASIPPRGEAHVGFSCVVTFGPALRVELDPAKASKADALAEMPPHVRDLYTRDHNIFGLATPIVRDLAAKLLREHPNPVLRAKAIHDHVASTLRYDGGGGWDPAPVVLERRSGSCSEFCYAFSALCRATGIPTRFVGASIFPAKSSLPFQDHGHHRWAEAWLPGHGWTPFDPTLDRRSPAKQDFVGTHHGRCLVLTRTGDKSQQLGLSYVGSNSHTGQTTRARWFTWTQGTRARLDEARRLIDAGRRKEGEAALRQLIADSDGSRAAGEARDLLRTLEPAPAGAGSK